MYWLDKLQKRFLKSRHTFCVKKSNVVVKCYKLFDRVNVSCLKNDRCLQWIWDNVCSKLTLDAIRHVRFTFYNFPYSVLAQCRTKFLSCYRIFSSDTHFHIIFILKYRGRGRIRKYSLLMKSQTTRDKWPYYALSYPIKSSLNPHNIRNVWRTLVFIWIGRGHPTRTELFVVLSIKKFDYTKVKADPTGWASSGARCFK